MYDDDEELTMRGWFEGHDVYRNEDDEIGGIWYDGHLAVDAMDYEEAEMEYWNTH